MYACVQIDMVRKAKRSFSNGRDKKKQNSFVMIFLVFRYTFGVECCCCGCLLVLVWMLFMCLVTWDKITLLIKMIMVCAHGHTQTKTAFYWRSFEAINSRTWDSKNSVCSICEYLFLCLIIWKAHKNDAQQESK